MCVYNIRLPIWNHYKSSLVPPHAELMQRSFKKTGRRRQRTARERQTKQKARRTHTAPTFQYMCMYRRESMCILYYICRHMCIQQIQQCVKNDKRKLLIQPPRSMTFVSRGAHDLHNNHRSAQPRRNEDSRCIFTSIIMPTHRSRQPLL